MLMTKKEKSEILQRLIVAQKKTNEMFGREPISRDLHPGSDIAQRWTLITAAYSGLEQTLKFLIAVEKSQNINELLNYQSQGNEGGKKSSGERFLFRTHSLATLFCHLEESTKDVVRDVYCQFQSLHSYIGIENLDDFLKKVSGNDGKGYERWRYSLIEVERELPHNSTEALITIWGICVEITRSRIHENQNVRMLDEKLTLKFYQWLTARITEVSIEQQDKGQRFQNLISEAHDRVFQDRHPLNVFAEILWHFEQYKSHGLTNVSDQLSATISRWCVADVDRYTSQSGMTSLWWFIKRAKGRTPNGESIQWNLDTRRFEDVPWSLKHLSQDDLPQNAFVVNDPPSQGTGSLQELKRVAKESEYKIRENRAFVSSVNPDKNCWYRTLEVAELHNMNPVLTIWQRQEYDCRRFAFVEECKTDEMSQPIQTWTKSNRILEQFGEFEKSE